MHAGSIIRRFSRLWRRFTGEYSSERNAKACIRFAAPRAGREAKIANQMPEMDERVRRVNRVNL